jgi:phage shock protein C
MTSEPHPWLPLPAGLCRDPQNGRISGVCAGLGRYFRIRVGYVRLAFILGSVFGLFPAVVTGYVMLVLLMPLPSVSGAAGNGGASPAGGLRARFDSLDRRLSRMEEWVTSEDYRLRQKFRDL